MTIIGQTTPPDFQARLDAFGMGIFNNLNCHEVAEVVSYDAGRLTAVVKISVLRLVNGQPTPYPLLTDCPVFVLSGGPACLTMPIAAGDPCLVLFNDRDIDIWFTTGNVTAPNSVRTHSLSDGMILVGFRNLAKPITGASATAVQLRNGTGVIGITGDVAGGSPALVDVHNGTGTLKQAMDLLFTALTSWVNTGGTTPNPATVILINAAKTAVDDLLL